MEDCTYALEKCDFCFASAIRWLLYGGDAARVSLIGTDRIRRQTNKTVTPLNKMLAHDSVREQYKGRALADLGLQANVVDFGQHAGATINAWFWLCLAAGLASSSWSPNFVHGQALPVDVATQLADARAMDLLALDRAERSLIKDTPLGLLAQTLRRHFCSGAALVLLRPRGHGVAPIQDPFCEMRK